MARTKALKSMVDDELRKMMEATSEPSEGRMKLLAIAIKKLALDAKLEENEFGDYFNTPEPGSSTGDETRPKPGAGKRANGSGSID